jgi:hypothetical protein
MIKGRKLKKGISCSIRNETLLNSDCNLRSNTFVKIGHGTLGSIHVRAALVPVACSYEAVTGVSVLKMTMKSAIRFPNM